MNNVFGGGNNPRTTQVQTTAEALNGPGTRKIVLPGVGGATDKSYIDGSGFNTLTGNIPPFTGLDIYENAGAADRDLTALVFGGGFGPTGQSSDPVFYRNTFGSGAGAYANGEKGTAVVASGVVVDANGRLVFPAGGYKDIAISSALPGSYKLTAKDVELAATGDACILNLRYDAGPPSKYLQILAIRQGDGTVTLFIGNQDSDTLVSQPGNVITNGVFNLIGTVDEDGNVAAKINSGAYIVYPAGEAAGVGKVAKILFTNGGKITEAEGKAL